MGNVSLNGNIRFRVCGENDGRLRGICSELGLQNTIQDRANINQAWGGMSLLPDRFLWMELLFRDLEKVAKYT